jgi:hypothetical protein
MNAGGMTTVPIATPAAAAVASGSTDGPAAKTSRLAGARAKASSAGKAAYGCGAAACGGFRDFIIRGNVVDLAVAFVVGAAFTKLIDAMVTSFITPLISAIFGGKDKAFDTLSFTLNGSVFTYGKFINALIS